MNFWPANSIYFITAKISLNKKIFNSDGKKRIILNQIRKAVNVLNISIYAYSIAMNHYHVLLNIEDYNKHSKFKQVVNGGSAFIYNKLYGNENSIGKMWLDSKSLIVYKQGSLDKVIGYIAGNLFKHNEVKDFIELKKTPFSSYRQLVEQYGDETAEDIVSRVINVEENDDGLIDLKELI